jgi:hypothetical protein
VVDHCAVYEIYDRVVPVLVIEIDHRDVYRWSMRFVTAC